MTGLQKRKTLAGTDTTSMQGVCMKWKRKRKKEWEPPPLDWRYFDDTEDKPRKLKKKNARRKDVSS